MTKEYDLAIAELNKNRETNNLTDESALVLALRVSKLSRPEQTIFLAHLNKLSKEELTKIQENG